MKMTELTADEAKKLIKKMDDGEWMFAFDSLGFHNYSDTLSAVQLDMPVANWKVFALLDYMQRCEAERP
jgi:hypothetical protein